MVCNGRTESALPLPDRDDTSVPPARQQCVPHGNRLRVEELEERIAPAVTLLPNEFATWDVSAGDNTWNASDGFIGLAVESSGITSIAVENFVDGGVTDTATLNITVTDGDAGAAVIVIGSSQSIGTINLTGLHAGTTSLTLIVGSSLTTTALAVSSMYS